MMEVIDALNRRFRRGFVKVSSCGLYSQWQMRQERKSPGYTTVWREIPSA